MKKFMLSMDDQGKIDFMGDLTLEQVVNMATVLLQQQVYQVGIEIEKQKIRKGFKKGMIKARREHGKGKPSNTENKETGVREGSKN